MGVEGGVVTRSRSGSRRRKVGEYGVEEETQRGGQRVAGSSGGGVKKKRSKSKVVSQPQGQGVRVLLSFE